MGLRRGALGIVVVLLALACKRAPEPPAPDHWPTSAVPLGKACEASPPAVSTKGIGDAGVPKGPSEICGRAGRVSVVGYVPRYPRLPGTPEVPASAVVRRTKVGQARAAVEGSRVLIAVDCWACRIDGEQLWVGDLDLMTEEQVDDFQRWAGLPEAPRLATAEAWRKALGG